jgi:hypothetical protein
MRHVIELVPQRSGAPFALVIRGGKVRRYKHLTAASLARVRCVLRSLKRG